MGEHLCTLCGSECDCGSYVCEHVCTDRETVA
jgi:hypothetical protein